MSRSFSTKKSRSPADIAALMRQAAARAAAAAQGGNAGKTNPAGQPLPALPPTITIPPANANNPAGNSGLQPNGKPLPIDYAAIAKVLGLSEKELKNILNAAGVKHKGKGSKDPKEKPQEQADKEQKKAQEKPWWMKNGPGLNALLSLGSRGAGLGMPEGAALPDNGAGALLDPEKLYKRINKLKASGKLPSSFPSNPPPAPSAPTK
jgi:hypothetical protein